MVDNAKYSSRLYRKYFRPPMAEGIFRVGLAPRNVNLTVHIWSAEK